MSGASEGSDSRQGDAESDALKAARVAAINGTWTRAGLGYHDLVNLSNIETSRIIEGKAACRQQDSCEDTLLASKRSPSAALVPGGRGRDSSDSQERSPCSACRACRSAAGVDPLPRRDGHRLDFAEEVGPRSCPRLRRERGCSARMFRAGRSEGGRRGRRWERKDEHQR
eukprot:753023-Hanusia_phi.AAC.3